jgi:vacuolar-type H+-ATPase subunit H
LTAETTQGIEEHYPDSNASKIQSAISILSQMETALDDLNNQVSDMKRRLTSFAETESEKTKAEILEQANIEAQQQLEDVRRAAQMEADHIIAKASSDLEAFRTRMKGRVSAAVDIIVNAVQSF